MAPSADGSGGAYRQSRPHGSYKVIKGAVPASSAIWIGPSKEAVRRMVMVTRFPGTALVLLGTVVVMAASVSRQRFFDEPLWAWVFLAEIVIFAIHPYVARKVALGFMWREPALPAGLDGVPVNFVCATREPALWLRWILVAPTGLLIPALLIARVDYYGGSWLFLLPALAAGAGAVALMPVWCLVGDLRTLVGLRVIELSGFQSRLDFSFVRAAAIEAYRDGQSGLGLATRSGVMWDPFGGYPLAAALVASTAPGEQAMQEAGLVPFKPGVAR